MVNENKIMGKKSQTKLPINLQDLLHQRKVEGDRTEYKTGWNPDPILRTLARLKPRAKMNRS
jgi:hypothetical protein